MIHGEALKLDRPLPQPVLTYEITLTALDNGKYGASVCIQGEEMGYACGGTTREGAIAFINERLAEEQ